MIYHVNIQAATSGDGSREKPFRTIQAAADIAMPGDEVLVYPGVYRESVNPIHAGTADAPIVYRSVEKHGAVITGAEPLTGWTHLGGGVWRAEAPNSIFSDRNPYTTLVSGDWFIASFIAHTGDVFLNGKSMYEVTDLDGVKNPVRSNVSWDPDFSVYTWYAQQDEARDVTVFTANFQDKDPNRETVEITARKSCFYPEAEGVGYITLSGFTVRQAATQWAPPTAYQEGMIGPHWSRGWVIEDCDISESKCSGISLGKYLQPGNDNKWLHWKYKDGTQTERECILQAQREGWTKERIGGHTVRRCDIHDCGQTGIVGHLGGAFSLIEDNHIHHINNKQNLAGAEIGGIKMHAAIDVIFRRNHIHHCTRGLWLDWQAQGTRVAQNFFHHNSLPFSHLMNADAVATANGEDIFIEVSHGPTLVDHNLMLSTRAMKLPTQGVAVVHNLIAGSFTTVGRGTDNGAKTLSSPRYTPYHVPHRTEVAGFMTFLHGDMRFYNNIFVQQGVHPFLLEVEDSLADFTWDDGNTAVGLGPYDGYPDEAEWKSAFEGYCGMGSEPSDRYYMPLPVWSEGNIFFNGAQPWDKEKNSLVDEENFILLDLAEQDGQWFLRTNLDECLPLHGCRMIDTDVLGMAFEPEQKFENPDGSPITFDRDYFGNDTGPSPTVGPIADGKLDGLGLDNQKHA